MRCKGHGEGKGAGAEQGREQLSRAEPEQQGQRPTATKRQGMKGREGKEAGLGYLNSQTPRVIWGSKRTRWAASYWGPSRRSGLPCSRKQS